MGFTGSTRLSNPLLGKTWPSTTAPLMAGTGIAGIIQKLCLLSSSDLQGCGSVSSSGKAFVTLPHRNLLPLPTCPQPWHCPRTYRDFFSHADLAEVGFHASAHLPDYCLCWLGLERPLSGVEFIPNCAVGRHC